MNHRNFGQFVPPDLYAKSPQKQAVNRWEPPPYNLGVAFYLSRGWNCFQMLVGTTAILLLSSNFAWPYIISNPSAATTVYIGPTSAVSTSSGFAINGGQNFSFVISDEVEIWGISSGSVTINILKV